MKIRKPYPAKITTTICIRTASAIRRASVATISKTMKRVSKYLQYKLYRAYGFAFSACISLFSLS